MSGSDKILYIISKSSWGGAQRYVYDLASALASDFQTTVAAGADELSHDNIFQKALEEKGVGFISVKHLGRDPGLFRDLKAFFELLSAIKKVRPSIVHLNSSKAGLLGALAARALRAPRIVFTVHGLPYNEKRSFVSRLIIKALTYLTFALVDRIVVLSKSEKKQIAKIFHKKIAVTHNACPAFELLSREEAREKLLKMASSSGFKKTQLTPDTVFLCSIAEAVHNKGLLEFLDELYKRRNENFLYFHFGSGELLKSLQDKTEKLGLESKVFWLGFDPQARQYLKAFDLFTLPSKKEGMPYALLEAGAANLYLYANPVGAVPEMLDCSQDKEILGFKACKLKEDFSFDIMLKKTKEIYFS